MNFTGFGELNGTYTDWLLTADGDNTVMEPDDLPTYKVYNQAGTELVAAADDTEVVIDMASGLFKAVISLTGANGFESGERYMIVYSWVELGDARTQVHVFGVL